MPYRFLCHFSQTMRALCLSLWKEHLILWGLSKSESEIPLTLLPGGSRKVQQGSGLWAATKPSLIFGNIEACQWIQLQASRCQPPIWPPGQTFCCYKIADFLSYLGTPSPSEVLKNKEWLPYCILTLQSARGKTDRRKAALLLPRSRQENVISLSGHMLHFAVPILCPCVVSKAQAGLRGLFDMETVH